MTKKRENDEFCRQVFLHADDLGMNRAVTDGIMHGFRHGFLTSTSLLSNAPDARRALALWKDLIDDQASGRLPSFDLRLRLGDPLSSFDLGVHLNLTQGRPLTGRDYPEELLDETGRFPGVIGLFSRLKRHGMRLYQQIHNELARQVEFLLDHGLQPTHVNGHQYIEMIPVVSEILPRLLSRYDIHVVRVAKEHSLLRTTVFKGFSWNTWLMARVKQTFAKRFHQHMEQFEVRHPGRFCGTAHAGQIDMPLIRLFLDDRDPFCQVEIGLHPASDAAMESIEADEDQPGDVQEGWNDPLAASRPNELRLLTSLELAGHLESRHYCLSRLSHLAAA